MRRRLAISLLLLAGASLAGCRGTHPPPVYAFDPAASFAGMKTYAWYDPPGFKIPIGDSIIDVNTKAIGTSSRE